MPLLVAKSISDLPHALVDHILAHLHFFELGMSICYVMIESLATQFTVTSTAAFQALWAPLGVLGFFTYPLKQAAQVLEIYD